MLSGVDTHGETSTVTKNGLSPSIGALEHVLSKEGHCICLNIHIVFVFVFFLRIKSRLSPLTLCHHVLVILNTLSLHITLLILFHILNSGYKSVLEYILL